MSNNYVNAFVLAAGLVGAANAQQPPQQPATGSQVVIIPMSPAAEKLRARTGAQIAPVHPSGTGIQQGGTPVQPQGQSAQYNGQGLHPDFKDRLLTEAANRGTPWKQDPESVCAAHLQGIAAPAIQSPRTPQGYGNAAPNLGKIIIKGIESKVGVSNEGSILGNRGQGELQAAQADQNATYSMCGNLRKSNDFALSGNLGAAFNTVPSLVNSAGAGGQLQGVKSVGDSMREQRNQDVINQLPGLLPTPPWRR